MTVTVWGNGDFRAEHRRGGCLGEAHGRGPVRSKGFFMFPVGSHKVVFCTKEKMFHL